MSDWRALRGTMLTREEEEATILAAKAGCQKSFTRLVRAHERLVLSHARYYCRFGTPRDELISEGMLGLVVAIRHFDPSKLSRLNTYATWWIKAYMRRFSIDNRRIVQPPHTRNTRRVLARLRTFEAQHKARTGERPDFETVADAMDVKLRDVEHIRAFLGMPDAEHKEDGLVRTHSAAQSPEAVCIQNEAATHVNRAIAAALEEHDLRTRYILKQRLLRDEPVTLAVLGEKLGLSRERVRQIERAASAEFYASVAAHLATLRSKLWSRLAHFSPKTNRKKCPRQSSHAADLAGSRTSTTCSDATLD